SRQVSQAQPNLQAIPNNDWLQILPQLNLSGLTQTLASHCLIKEQTDNRIHLILDPNQAALRNPRQEVRLAEALSAYFGRPVAIHISLGEANMSTPARLATQSLENDA